MVTLHFCWLGGGFGSGGGGVEWWGPLVPGSKHLRRCHPRAVIFMLRHYISCYNLYNQAPCHRYILLNLELVGLLLNASKFMFDPLLWIYPLHVCHY